MPTVEERLATLEESKRIGEAVQDDLREYMKEGRDWREETTKCMSRMEVNQDNFRIYQIHCDTDRGDLVAKNTALDKRVADTEGFQKRQMKMGCIIAILASGIGVTSPKIAQKLVEWLS